MQFYLECVAMAEQAKHHLSKEWLTVFLEQDVFDPFADHYLVAEWIGNCCLTEDSWLYHAFREAGITHKEEMSRYLLPVLWLLLRLKQCG